MAHDRLAFYTDLRGSTLSELLALLSVVPAALLLRRALPLAAWPHTLALDLALPLALLLAATSARSTLPWRTAAALAPADAAPGLARQWAGPVTLTLLALALWATGRAQRKKSGRKSEGPRDQRQRPEAGRRAFVSVYRAAMMLATCLAILAVDFDAFPRRFAKTETFGVSLMDAGVGGFVFSAALVSRAARQPPSAAPGRVGPPSGLWTRLLRALRAAAPLWVLALARLAATRGAALDAHVSEYGVHWNFFMTLASVALVVALLDVPARWAAPLGAALLAAYQSALSAGGLTAYVLTQPRTNLLHANKEGVCSWLGFLALYLLGVGAGRVALHAPYRSPRALLRAALLVGATFALALAVGATVQPPSRRLANAAYVLLCAAVNGYVLLACALVDALTTRAQQPPPPSPLLDAVNENQLLTFLAANLLTGAVNLALDTQSQPAAVAVPLLAVYMLCVSGVALAAKKLGIRLKI